VKTTAVELSIKNGDKIVNPICGSILASEGRFTPADGPRPDTCFDRKLKQYQFEAA